ncbi:MAG: acetoin utilization protein AcuB [Gammaproteobacteria bacterium]|nr:MAG: acetoin utilization protein AcuB [Gammaproteobacteria bacterium]
MMNLDMIMSTNLITISPKDNLAKARELMHDNSIHHLPVCVDKELVGLVTLTNVLAATDSILRDPDSRLHAKEILIEDMMVKDIATVDENASLRQAALFLEKHRIGCLPIVTDGNLHGIVTDTDFVGVAINLLEQIEDTEPVDESGSGDI